MDEKQEVYIVTSGSYSDYGIRRVFLDKSKAEWFAGLHTDYEVETWDSSDSVRIDEIRYIEVDYRVDRINGWSSFDATVQSTSTVESDADSVERWTYFYREPVGKDILRLVRVIPSDLAVQEAQACYRRICDDLYAEIRSLIEVERWSEEMVHEWLMDKGRLCSVS